MHQETKCLLAGFVILLAPATLRADDPPPKGEVKNYTFSDSKIFPGTTRGYSIYVPQQYDPARPACVHIHQDGIPYNGNNIPAERRTPAILDNLIARKEIPVVIGVFVAPGVVKATSPGALDRLNRSFEYDGLGDAYARFLLEELLPDVEKKTTSDGRAIKLSKKDYGNDRSIGGASSGDRRVHGSLEQRPMTSAPRLQRDSAPMSVSEAEMSYPTLIRKYEPEADPRLSPGQQQQPEQLRRRLVDGEPVEMERSLKFAGYEVEGTSGRRGRPRQRRRAPVPRYHEVPVERLARGVTRTGQGAHNSRTSWSPAKAWQLVGLKAASSPKGRPSMPRVRSSSTTSPRDKTLEGRGLDNSVSPYISDTKRANGACFGARRPDVYGGDRNPADHRLRRRPQEANRARRWDRRQRPDRPPRRPGSSRHP